MSAMSESNQIEMLRFIATRETEDAVANVANLAIDLVMSWGLETADAIYILTSGYHLAESGPDTSCAVQNEAQHRALTAYQKAIDDMHDIVRLIEQAAEDAVDGGDDDEA
jgi:hypothetical protein